ncbi:fused response regulator/thioredoxin-disulfide reductase (plasmid) [Deinococcus aetherius]|uniref:Fused response regulator/thioredoxin-disulfide reductase n=1 Tax=Deinococcus aetherius TaxID=200252 RepID=A0ABN6RPK1_9DEIO|nr:FAD-dependent oxidoreductase [Deinococcus aetherius]BDP43691.1 fused response regulator/thioredoxin-disulfide reductase [Deinococcus aetherius]
MATKPVILTADDDPQVLRAVERDLRAHYGREYRILRAASGPEAMGALRELAERGTPVALIVSDHRMPEMDGVEFLGQTVTLFPDTKRVLLTAYADTDAAIRAINVAGVDRYLLKPWDPPEERLYPVLDDLLAEWQASYRPAFEGVRVLGSRWSPRAYELREFLARNHVPYLWLDIEARERDAEVSRLASTLGDPPHLPLVVLPDGTRLDSPTPAELSGHVGLQTRADRDFYDLVIVGGGPAGLASAVYGASEGLRTLIVEREAPGGQAGLSSRIENYLGFSSGISGSRLAQEAVTQAKRFGVEIVTGAATALRVEGPYRVLELADGSSVSSHAVIIATGVQWRQLDVPGLERLQGAGVYYGAGTTEALAVKDETVYIVGGANSAGQAAMNFARFAREVVMLVRGPSLTASMSQYLIEQIEQTPGIRVELNSGVVGVHGEERLEAIDVFCSSSGETQTLPATSLFIFIGAQPGTEWLSGVLERDGRGFILSGPELMKGGKRPPGWPLDRDPGLLETSVPGVFVVGDVRLGSVKRVASGVGEGSVAISFVHQYLANV